MIVVGERRHRSEHHVVRVLDALAPRGVAVVAVDVCRDLHVGADRLGLCGDPVPEVEVAVGLVGEEVLSRLVAVERDAVRADAEPRAVVLADVQVARHPGVPPVGYDLVDDALVGDAQLRPRTVPEMARAVLLHRDVLGVRLLEAVLPLREGVAVCERIGGEYPLTAKPLADFPAAGVLLGVGEAKRRRDGIDLYEVGDYRQGRYGVGLRFQRAYYLEPVRRPVHSVLRGGQVNR